jgi:hypothetical protein
VDGDMRVWRYNEVSLHGKKTGLDNFMAICEFGDELEDNKQIISLFLGNYP